MSTTFTVSPLFYFVEKTFNFYIIVFKVEILHAKSLKQIASVELDENKNIGDVKKAVALQSKFKYFLLFIGFVVLQFKLKY